MRQSGSFGANYKAAYCLSLCPAGEQVIAPFLTDLKEFLEDVVKPLQDKVETIYVVPGSDFEEYVARDVSHFTAERVPDWHGAHRISWFSVASQKVFRHSARHIRLQTDQSAENPSGQRPRTLSWSYLLQQDRCGPSPSESIGGIEWVHNP